MEITKETLKVLIQVLQRMDDEVADFGGEDIDATFNALCFVLGKYEDEQFVTDFGKLCFLSSTPEDFDEFYSHYFEGGDN